MNGKGSKKTIAKKMDFFVLRLQYIYHMQIEGLGRRNSQGLERVQVNELSKRTHRASTSHQFLAKLYLTREILEDCLATFDIFKEMLEDPIQKIKIIRDIIKTVHLKIYEEGAVIYGKGESSTSIYMVIKGAVSLCVAVPKEYKEGEAPKQTDTIDVEYQQINTFYRGEGFGQADFIHGKKRSLLAQAKISNTVVGQINGQAFAEVIESYKQRVYLKKIEMFGKCPLLQGLAMHQIQFIVNNAKPFSFSYAKEVAKQGDIPSSFYMIAEGEIELRKQFEKSPQKPNRHSLKNKITVEQAVKEKIKLKSMVVGILQQGQFLGDAELALSTPFTYSSVCKSQKVRVYICDQRIILSQIPKEKYDEASKYYKQKIHYRQQKTKTYNIAREVIQQDIQANEIQKLSKDQMKIKRMISNRYVEKIPSLIGQMSPRDIGKIVQKKYERLKSEPLLEEKQITYFPLIGNKNNSDILRANQRGYSPLLKKRKHYSPSPSPPKQAKQSISLSYNSLQSHINPAQDQHPHGSLLVHMRPFHSKVRSLHQRLSQMGEQTITRKYQLSKLPVNIVVGSDLQQKRMSEFISKIKEGKKRK